ncbi:SUMF1/EgtB/PvdO family nonheme iron enzyme [Membranihabitans maritimus]|uniref:SUMF1/EgtB/PvdO family nonheme iron enzyme n=1 Tax=Membranihabitans maritimus TaxID=2904244 RepID=UPI001F2E3FF8|nr:SUMF1/EgtB/PvdO family nonheme iron enzyme [Membranihabitans maritimus]
MHKFLYLLSVFCLIGSLSSCKKSNRSSTTGWVYNSEEWGGFQKLDYDGQITGPNLVLIEGGTFTMGNPQEDVMYRWDAVPRRVTVSSFYMDETEVANIDYREFVYWNSRVFGEQYPERVMEILPDTMVWREELAYNEPYVENYFRHPSYDEYPVVGVSWQQANEYCKWRTDRVNEYLLIEKGILNPNPEQKNADNFNTDAYLAGQYEGSVKENLKDLGTGGERPVNYSDGIMLPSYRLPTEAEWEYAAYGLTGNLESENNDLITDRRIYPWDGNTLRYKWRGKAQGQFLANFKRKGGNYMGVAGNLNDKAAIPGPVRNYYPNDFGLYNMAGNVSEWVADVYRPTHSLTLRDVDNQDLNPFRGNVFKTAERNEDGSRVEKDEYGRLQERPMTEEELKKIESIDVVDARDYLDGDEDSGADYVFGENSLVSDSSRVIKGGSWADRPYWLSPGTRRFMGQTKASRSVGFRCAMTRNGPSAGNDSKGGNVFKKASKKRNRRRY